MTVGILTLRSAHDHTGDDLIAGRHDYHALKAVELGNGLDFAADEVAGRESVAIAGGVAANAVADTGDGQLKGEAAGGVYLILHFPNELLIKRIMTGVHFIPSIDKADNGAFRHPPRKCPLNKEARCDGQVTRDSTGNANS